MGAPRNKKRGGKNQDEQGQDIDMLREELSQFDHSLKENKSMHKRNSFYYNNDYVNDS